tara:strand:- start:701 stop:1213 length:513 start_codon:yes stop_codon:yes gene_type:complete
MKVNILPTNRLTKKQILSICKLKNSFWKFGLKSNIKWFNRYIQKKDINFILHDKDKADIIGYTALRLRTFFYNNKKFKYYYFDTIIVEKLQRDKGYSKLLMSKIKMFIKNQKISSFLLCDKKMEKYYKKLGWNDFKKQKFYILDHKIKQKIGLFFNSEFKRYKIYYLIYD